MPNIKKNLRKTFFYIAHSEVDKEDDSGLPKPSFFDDISRHRSGGIDVSKHSKQSRILKVHTHEPTPSPKAFTRNNGAKMRVRARNEGSFFEVKQNKLLSKNAAELTLVISIFGANEGYFNARDLTMREFF